jgi:hypothetical protein
MDLPEADRPAMTAEDAAVSTDVLTEWELFCLRPFGSGTRIGAV